MPTLPASPKFPNFKSDNHSITSPITGDYNCIGWAAGEDDRFWWPVHNPLAYWPLEVPDEVTVKAFIEAFATKGYVPCKDGKLEAGYEKVVLYVDKKQVPTHMARQLENGEWTSKLGSSFDITHKTPVIVNGSEYGTVFRFLRREKAQDG